MSSSLNKVTLIGNVGRDVEIRYSNDSKKIASFSIATSENWTKDGTAHEKTEWHRIVCFSDNLSKIIEQYVKKGSKLYIEGQLQTRKWTDNDGVERYTTEVVMQGFNCTLKMLDKKQSEEGAGQ